MMPRYGDDEFERMQDDIRFGNVMLAATLAQIDIERNKRIMGCRRPLPTGFVPPPNMYQVISVSIHISTTMDLILNLALIPLISSMNRSIDRAEKHRDLGDLGALEMSEAKLKALYDACSSVREAGFVNIDSYYDQFQTLIARANLDRSDRDYESSGWTPTDEERAESAKRAVHAQKDRQKRQQEEQDATGKVKEGRWPSFESVKRMVGTDDYGKPKLPEGT